MTTATTPPATKVKVSTWSTLQDRQPTYALVANVDLVVIRYDDEVSVLYGRCLHRGALLADGHVEGRNLICGVHYWDYRYDTGVSEYNNAEALHRFAAWIDRGDDAVYVDGLEVGTWARRHPQPYKRDEYLGLHADIHGTPEEPHNKYIQQLARKGREGLGHGAVSAMGVARQDLPSWDDIQLLTAQLARKPLLDGVEVGAELVIGPARRHRHLLRRGRDAPGGAGQQLPLLLRIGVGPFRLEPRQGEAGPGVPLQGRPGG
jgi:nitrite reductase/ring-hydroxylating ferredoxin subunit